MAFKDCWCEKIQYKGDGQEMAAVMLMLELAKTFIATTIRSNLWLMRYNGKR